MHSFLHNKIKNLLLIYTLVNQTGSLLISISGGQDSLCLMKILHDFQIVDSYSLKFVHFDHNWREDSFQNACLVAYISHKWDLELYTYQLPDSIDTEINARKWRYKMLYFIAYQNQCVMIITAHTYNDKIESFLLNLVRGCALEGLSPLFYMAKISTHLYLSRPLLPVKRYEIAWFCRKFFLPVWSDSTNYNYIIKRNRIRQELLPYIQQFLNLQFEKQINYTIYFIYRDYEYLEYIALYFYYQLRHDMFAALNSNLLSLLHFSIQYRIFKIFLKHNFSLLANRSQIQQLLLLIKFSKLHYITIKIILDFKAIIFYNNGEWIYCCWHQEEQN